MEDDFNTDYISKGTVKVNIRIGLLFLPGFKFSSITLKIFKILH